jgi:hypothetical protein
MFQGILREEITSSKLREDTGPRTLLPEIFLNISIRCFYIYLKLFKNRLQRSEFKSGSASSFNPGGANRKTKPRLLCVTDKWTRSNPAFGPSTNEHNLFGTLEVSGLATYSRFHFDEYRLQHKRIPCDFALLRTCLETKPDLMVFAYAGGGLCPRWMTLGLVRRMGIPVVTFWWDYPGSLSEQASLFIDLNVGVYSPFLQKTTHPEKYFITWVPEDTRVFYDPGIPRDIDISFVGSMKNRGDRYAGITALKASGIDVYRAGGQLEQPLPINEYANRFMRSKIALNFGFSEDKNGVRIPLATGRIFEAALCGAMVLSTGNPETDLFFEPGVEYVPFTDENDLVEKAKYYLEHVSEREAIAARGQKKVKENYRPEKFWGAIFDRVIPEKFSKGV